jgi:hypothetical protein
MTLLARFSSYFFFHEKNALYIQKDIKIYKDRSHGRQLNLGRMLKTWFFHDCQDFQLKILNSDPLPVKDFQIQTVNDKSKLNLV